MFTFSLICVPLLDAMSVLKGMLDSGSFPTRPAVTALIQALAEKGDLKNLQTLKTMLEDITSPISLSPSLIPNAIALAHTKK